MALPFSTNTMVMAENIRKLEDFDGSIPIDKIPKDYSTTEQDTGVKWVDGSEIYRKCVVYDGSGFTAATYKTITTINGINEVIEGYCTSKLTGAGYYYVLKPNSVRAAINGGVDFRFDSTVGATDGGYAILYYTKVAPSALTASPDRALNVEPEAEPEVKKVTKKKTTK